MRKLEQDEKNGKEIVIKSLMSGKKLEGRSVGWFGLLKVHREEWTPACTSCNSEMIKKCGFELLKLKML